MENLLTILLLLKSSPLDQTALLALISISSRNDH